MPLARGTLLHNRYRVVDILGQGGMGSVYRAIDEVLGVEVAVKDNMYTSQDFVRQFRREAMLLAGARHPCIPRVTDYFVNEQGQYLVMDYVLGEDLRQRMDRVGSLSDEEVIIIGAAVCDGLTYLHSQKPSIIHRDIKPGNVKITPQGQVLLVDFGLAKVLEGGKETTSGARAMTPGYSPPEQYGSARTDQRSDIYSLGATLYAALTEVTPEDALVRAMGQSELTPIRKHNPRVSRKLAAVIEKCLSVHPDARYQSAEELKNALLGCRLDTRRRKGDFTVAPPPFADQSDLPQEPFEEEIYDSDQGAWSEGEKDVSLLPLPASVPIKPASIPSGHVPAGGEKSANKWSRIWQVFLAIFVFGAAATYYLRSPWGNALLAVVMPPRQSLPAIDTQRLNTLTPVDTSPLASSLSPTQARTAEPLASLITLPPGAPTLAATLTPVVLPAQPSLPSFTPRPTSQGGGASQVAFASDRTGLPQIYLINLDGSGLVQLTKMEDGACQPSWGPDGVQLVFTSPCNGNRESYPGSALFLINADGSGLVPLQTVPGGDYDPAWSPDGKQIAFTSLRGNGRPQIYVYDLSTHSVTGLSERYARDMQPAWAPDGKKIAVVTTRHGSTQIWTMNADGSNQMLFSRSKDFINTHPSWSPDGKFLLFTQLLAAGAIPRLVIAPLESEYEEYVLTQDSIPMREGKFSSDGFWIVFEGWPAGSFHNVYMIGVNGGSRMQLTEESHAEFDPAWRPLLLN